MRIKSLLIENFRAIQRIEMNNLPNAVVVAGPNGCGKSSLFDAIRLLKSAYGQYSPNEYRAWFNEFNIDINEVARDTQRVLHDPMRPLKIQVVFEVTSAERNYLKENNRDLYLKQTWEQFAAMPQLNGEAMIANPAQKRGQGPIVESQTKALIEKLNGVIDDEQHVGELTINPGEAPKVKPAPVLELMFSVWGIANLGVIEYYSPNRDYRREIVTNLNFQIQDSSRQQSQNALYNTQNKYSGVKTQMAQSYVRQILAEKAGISIKENNVNETLDELFKIFFPGKTFLGVQPTSEGGLSFLVRLQNGREHDINDLSSGEKEVLLGYLRLRNSAPSNSIILLDEPELHLNPRLIRGLPRFYQKYVGEALNNQLWLITHSDTLLREAVDEPAYVVYHMQYADTTHSNNNQLDQISTSENVERAIIDLVGDLATYNPRSKILFVEGQDSEFDANMILELFPQLLDKVNVVSVGSKHQVNTIHSILAEVSENGKLGTRFYSVVDKDFIRNEQVDSVHRFAWDVYHIENYLLNPEFIRQAISSIELGNNIPTEEEISQQLRECAEETIDDLVRITMEQEINSALVQCISTKFDPKQSAAKGFHEAAERSLKKMKDTVEKQLNTEGLKSKEDKAKRRFSEALNNGMWSSEFRGRDILKKFVKNYKPALGVPYEKLRNIIINRMRDAEHRPEGMVQVISKVLEDHNERS